VPTIVVYRAVMVGTLRFAHPTNLKAHPG